MMLTTNKAISLVTISIAVFGACHSVPAQAVRTVFEGSGASNPANLTRYSVDYGRSNLAYSQRTDSPV